MRSSPRWASGWVAPTVSPLPRLEKVVVNMGVGSAVGEKKHMEDAVEAMSAITGQKPVITRARKSIAGFKLREGMAIGCMVTMRGRRMFEFPGSVDLAGLAAGSRLPGAESQRLRWQRQLQPGAFRAVGLPGIEPGQVHPVPKG